MRIFILFIFMAIAAVVYAQRSSTGIQFDGVAGEVVADLRNALQGYNAGNISITSVPFSNRTGQEFYLSSQNGKTEIRYTTQNSLENAIYTYLDLLGFRWYGPGENWFVKPKNLPIVNFPGKWYTPTFRNRSFFGTGGLDFGVAQAYDPNNNYKKNWYAWKRRNRFNMDFRDVGHTGSAFYLANKNLLDANPKWFASEAGKVSGRLRIDQSRAVDAYKRWVKNVYNTSKLDFIVLGVDPEDGRGGADDPLPSNGFGGIRNWNHADKWWWLANEVAKDYPENDKSTVVSMYAYGDGATNALAPSFNLRKNVYPIIIPYAFQKAYLPDEMVKVWASKINGNMGIYDYWNITQWSVGMPQFSIYSIQPKLKFWSQNKIDGIYLETTDAAGPMGHALWLAGQLQWDNNKNFEQLYSQYLADCFGKAAPAMRKMYDRWSNNYQGAGDVALSLDDLKQATTLVQKDSPEWKRLNDLKAYVHFMKLYYEHDGTQQSKDRIFRYLYSIHHLMMVQTAAFVGQAYIAPLTSGNIVPSGTGVKRLSAREIESQFLQDLRRTPKTYDIVDFRFDLDKVKYTEPIPNESWRFGGFQCNFFFKAPFTGPLILDVGAESVTPFKFFTNDKVIVNEEVGTSRFDHKETIIGRTWSMKKYKLNIEKGKTYFLQTSYGFSRIKINTPNIVLFKNPGAQDFDNYAYPVQYFYVPKNAKEIVFFDLEAKGGATPTGRLISPDGVLMTGKNTGAKDIFVVEVLPKYRGTVWKATFGHPSWSFKNIPNITSLQKFEYKE